MRTYIKTHTRPAASVVYIPQIIIVPVQIHAELFLQIPRVTAGTTVLAGQAPSSGMRLEVELVRVRVHHGDKPHFTGVQQCNELFVATRSL